MLLVTQNAKLHFDDIKQNVKRLQGLESVEKAVNKMRMLSGLVLNCSLEYKELRGHFVIILFERHKRVKSGVSVTVCNDRESLAGPIKSFIY